MNIKKGSKCTVNTHFPIIIKLTKKKKNKKKINMKTEQEIPKNEDSLLFHSWVNMISFLEQTHHHIYV